MLIFSRTTKGFSLVEIMISIAILSVVMLAIFNLIIFVVKITKDNGMRLTATAIANQKMEYVRSLPYSSVGTISGMVSGVIPNDENVVRNNITYRVITTVKYVDDAYDGTISTMPKDLRTNDYKNVAVTVTYYGPFGNKDITAFSIIAPKGIESDIGGGTLIITVIDAKNQPIQGASVNIVNNLVSPPINYSDITATSGQLVFPAATTSVEGYKITATKAGYSTDYTVDRIAPNLRPFKPNASIYEDTVTEVTLVIDLLSNMLIKAVTAALPQNWKISSDTSGEAQSNSRLTVDGSGNIYVVWEDNRLTGASKIMAQKYNPSKNAQWPNTTAPEDQYVSTSNKKTVPDVLVDQSGNLYAAWGDGENGQEDIFIAKLLSTDGSAIWNHKVVTNADNFDQRYPRIALTDNGTQATTTLVWQDNRSGNWDIYVQNINSSGNNQWTPEFKANRDSGTTDQYEPMVITSQSGDIYIVWTDERNGDKDIYLAKYASTSNFLWEIKANNDGGVTSQYQADIAKDSGDNIYLSWTDERNGDKDIYMQKYNPSDGSSVWPNDKKINSIADTSNQYSPSMAINSTNNIYLVWTDDRNGDLDIYAQMTDNNGDILWPDDVRIDINNDSTSQSNPDIYIDPTDNMPYASWQDDQNGDLDIYATKFSSYGTENPVASVLIRVWGAKIDGDDGAAIPTYNYKFDHNYTTDGSGNVNLNDIEFDSYSIELQTGYTAHQIIMIAPIIPISLSPDSTQSVKIYLD